ncbi:hypothetical protein Syun_018747 [Stephania yunnanensis]|uniref:Uncharacterized protein n=1 Tax=Stephania yunnanensis TaxID=152371 RepID=A0AAP0ITH0_9MAGN
MTKPQNCGLVAVFVLGKPRFNQTEGILSRRSAARPSPTPHQSPRSFSTPLDRLQLLSDHRRSNSSPVTGPSTRSFSHASTASPPHPPPWTLRRFGLSATAAPTPHRSTALLLPRPRPPPLSPPTGRSGGPVSPVTALQLPHQSPPLQLPSLSPPAPARTAAAESERASAGSEQACVFSLGGLHAILTDQNKLEQWAGMAAALQVYNLKHGGEPQGGVGTSGEGTMVTSPPLNGGGCTAAAAQEEAPTRRPQREGRMEGWHLGYPLRPLQSRRAGWGAPAPLTSPGRAQRREVESPTTQKLMGSILQVEVDMPDHLLGPDSGIGHGWRSGLGNGRPDPRSAFNGFLSLGALSFTTLAFGYLLVSSLSILSPPLTLNFSPSASDCPTFDPRPFLALDFTLLDLPHHCRGM